MQIIAFLFFCLGLSQISWAQKSITTFEVMFKGNKIGTLHATAEKSGTQLTEGLKTITDTKIGSLSIHVESDVNATHKEGILVEGTAYRHANRGKEDVDATVTILEDASYQVERNGKKEKIENVKINFCVVDLFFQEPVGIKTLFSNMHVKMLELKTISPGKYVLVTPDKKDSTYTYKDGKLITIESDTPLGKVISKRTGQ